MLSRLLLFRRHLVLDVSDKGDPHLGGVVATENVTHKVRLDLHLYLDSGSAIGPRAKEPSLSRGRGG